MPSRKRRNEEEDDSDEEPQRTQRRPRAPAIEESEEDEDANGDEMDVGGGDEDQFVKKFVRYALACEYQRTSIKRIGVADKVFNKRRVPFKQIFDKAQQQLRTVFGMQMVELPSKEKITTREKRAALKAKGNSKPAAAWIVVSVLPAPYRIPEILAPSTIGSAAEEATYIGLCTMIVSIIALSPTSTIPAAKMETYLRRLNADRNMVIDTTANILKRMERQGYIYRSVDKNGDEETVDWVVGPRGKIEIGNRGIQGLVNEVYGENAPEDLQVKMQRSLQISSHGDVDLGNEEADAEPELEVGHEGSGSNVNRRRSGRQHADTDSD